MFIFQGDGLFQAIQFGSSLVHTLLTFLSHAAMVVCSETFFPLSVSDQQIDKNNFSDQKTYFAFLRDIHGLLTILIRFSEFKSGREYLLFHNVADHLYKEFMVPFIMTLNGTENADPQYYNDYYREKVNATWTELWVLAVL